MAMNDQDRLKMAGFFGDTLTIAEKSLDSAQAAVGIISALLDKAAAGTLTPDLIDGFRRQSTEADAIFATDRADLNAIRQQLEAGRLLMRPTRGWPS